MTHVNVLWILFFFSDFISRNSKDAYHYIKILIYGKNYRFLGIFIFANEVTSKSKSHDLLTIRNDDNISMDILAKHVFFSFFLSFKYIHVPVSIICRGRKIFTSRESLIINWTFLLVNPTKINLFPSVRSTLVVYLCCHGSVHSLFPCTDIHITGGFIFLSNVHYLCKFTFP